MAIPYSVSEVLTLVNRTPDFEDRVNELSKRTAEYHRVFATLFQAAFDPQASLMLPIGTFDYRPCDYPGVYSKLYGEVIHRFYIFTDPSVSEKIRINQFIHTLESVDPDDAKTLIAVKDQNLPSLYPNITLELVDRVFPELNLSF